LPRIARSAVDLGAYEYQNTPPVAGDDSFTTSEDEAASGNVLANDTDVDGDALSVVAVNGSAAGIGHSVATAHGSVTLNADGTFTYKPGAACEATSDTFTYAISDGHGGTSAASVNISIVRAVADGAIELSEGLLRIGGTAGHDLITVIQLGGTVFVAHVGQGGYAAFDASQVAEIRIWGREAGDLVTLINVRADSAIFGGDGDDILVGGRGQDVIFGGSGDDLVTGGAGDDFLIGGAGRDRLVGGSGDDVLVAGDVACEFSLQMLRDISRAWAEFRCTPEEEGDGALGKAIVDTDYDILTGSSGADLFFISAGDKITDYRFDKPKANKDGDVVRFVD
jgi:Ca2+-binding RTX toxin-like protein